RFRAEKDHRATGTLNGGEGGIRISCESIDARFAPPTKTERSDAIAQFSGVAFLHEKIHIVELHGIGAILGFQVAQNRFRTRGTLHQLAISINCVHPAETAAEWAADAGVMRGSSFAEEGRPEILFYRHTMKWRPRKSVGPLQEPFGIVTVQAEN